MCLMISEYTHFSYTSQPCACLLPIKIFFRQFSQFSVRHFVYLKLSSLCSFHIADTRPLATYGWECFLLFCSLSPHFGACFSTTQKCLSLMQCVCLFHLLPMSGGNNHCLDEGQEIPCFLLLERRF